MSQTVMCTIADQSRDVEPEAIVFTVELLPVGHGDSLLLEYGIPGQTRFVLIDGGPLNKYAELRQRIAKTSGELELLVVTHVDADHIEGVVNLLRDQALALRINEIWFNGWPQLETLVGTLSPVTGEYLAEAITNRHIPWNRPFWRRPTYVDQTSHADRVEWRPPPHGTFACKRQSGKARGTVERNTAQGRDATRVHGE